MSKDSLLIAGSLAALVVVSAATFFCSQRRRPRSASQRSDALGRDAELGGGLDDAVLAAYPTLLFSSASPSQHGGEGKEEMDKEEEEDDEEENKAPGTAATMESPAGDTAARCAVCQADYADGDELRLLPECQHAFHRRCVDQWLRRRPTCPVCRASSPPASSKA